MVSQERENLGESRAFKRFAGAALAVCGVAFLLMAGLVWRVENIARADEAAGRRRLGLAIERMLAGLTDDAATLTIATPFMAQGDSAINADPKLTPAASRAWRKLPILFLVDIDRETAIERSGFAAPARFDEFAPTLKPLLESLRAPLVMPLRGGLAGDAHAPPPAESVGAAYEKPRSGLALIDGAPYAIVGAVVETRMMKGAANSGGETAGGQSRLALVGLTRLGANALNQMALDADVGRIEVVDAAAPTGASRRGDTFGDIGAPHPVLLAFEPNQPSGRLALRVGLGFGLIALLAAIAALLRSRQLVDALAYRETAAKQAVGQDLLTGMGNRLSFAQTMESEFARSERTGSPFALFYLDIDRLKAINDTYGHAAGDRLIAAVAQALKGALRRSDFLARLSGDEFAILQTEIDGPRDCEMLAQRIVGALAHEFVIGDHTVFAHMSIGVALYPNDARDLPSLERAADLALYRAKSEGRNRYCFFERTMGEQLRMRKTVEDDLRRAIAQDELMLHYLPIISSATQKTVGVEALVRWRHPAMGLLSPARFVGLAEESGIILPLGAFVLERACRDAAAWPGLRLAVNVSPVQFLHKDFLRVVADVLQRTGFDATRLEIEITESVLLADREKAESVMFELRLLGVRISLDDFGSGIISLIFLRRFAFDRIKIDNALFQTMEAGGESARIVESIVKLGEVLDLTIIAEGVETREQFDLARKLGCQEMQGFYLSMPLPADQVERFVNNPAPVHVRAQMCNTPPTPQADVA